MKYFQSGVRIGVKSTLVALVLSTAGFVSPAFAISDSDVNLGDSICDLVGSGTATDPYQVATAKQLAEITSCNDGAHYKYYIQTANINILPTSNGSQDGWNDTNSGNLNSSGGWVPIGDSNSDSNLFTSHNPFFGSYDGHNYNISGLTIERASTNQGLFGATTHSEVKNLVLGDVNGIISSSVKASNQNNIGALIGESGYTNISNVSVSHVDVQAGSNVGGISGYLYYSNLEDVTYRGNISALGSALAAAGGIAGNVSQSNVHRATVEATIQGDLDNGDGTWSGASYVGGIAGEDWYSSLIATKFTGEVNASNQSGGIAGYGGCATIASAEFNGQVRGSYGQGNNYSPGDIGGIVGYWEEGQIRKVIMNGDISVTLDSADEGTLNIGGVAGYLEYSSVTDAAVYGNTVVSSSGGSTSRNSDVGGVVGGADSGVAVSDSFVKGNVTTTDTQFVGGIVGYDYYGVAVSGSRFEGQVVNTMTAAGQTYAYVGGLIGYAGYAALITSSNTSATASVSSSPDKSNSTYVGGLVGGGGGALQISDSYNRANVSGYDKVAGILGSTDGSGAGVSIIHTYTTGTVSADASATSKDVFANAVSYHPIGTVVGYNTFDKAASAASTSTTGVAGNTTAAMKIKATYTSLGFNFDSSAAVWAINASTNDGYPYLVAPAIAGTTDVFGPLKFKKGTSMLTKTSKAKLATYGALVKAGNFAKVTVRVYTTSTNTRLAVSRAIVIAKALKKHGVSVALKKEAVTRSSKVLNNTAKLFAKHS